MSARARGSVAIVLVGIAAALVVTSIPRRSGVSPSSGIPPFVAAALFVAGAVTIAFPLLCRIGQVRRDVRRGLRQIDLVLTLEAALAARRVTVAGSATGCPNCGAPAGPHCVCRKR